jgi:hypothetical protein
MLMRVCTANFLRVHGKKKSSESKEIMKRGRDYDLTAFKKC